MKPMCLFWNRWVGPYATGTLRIDRPKLAARFDEHMESCADCRDCIAEISAMDGALRDYSRSSRLVERLEAPSRNKPSLSMANRVLTVIRPEEKYVSQGHWTPGALSFVSAGAFALVAITFMNPQSGARAWFYNALQNKHTDKQAIVRPLPPPFPANHDPFKAKLSPSLNDAADETGSESVGVTSRAPMPSIARYSDTDAQSVTNDTAQAPTPSSSRVGTARGDVSTAPQATNSQPDQTADTSEPASASTFAPSPDLPSLAPAVRAATTSVSGVPYSTAASVAPPSPPNALTNVSSPIAQSELAGQPDGPLTKRSVLQSVGDGTQTDVAVQKRNLCGAPRTDAQRPSAASSSNLQAGGH